MNRSLVVRGTIAAALAAAAIAMPSGRARADGDSPSLPVRRPVAAKPIDLVLCLDTSGSMEGLINAARTKLWEVVNLMARAKPAPSLRVALLTYGSPGDDAAGHVILQTGFTKDLDLVSEKLFALGTNGGDEYVGRVVKTAVDRLEWGGVEALKILFVAGNESADQDKATPFRDVVRHASGLGVRVNSIYCGNPDDPDAKDWREVATLGLGRFATIEKDTGTVVIVTPYDKELLELSGRINTTYVGYGRKAKESLERQSHEDGNAAAAPAAGAARAESKAGGLYDNSSWDLIDRMAQKDFDLAKVPVDDLPEEMKKLSLDEKKAFLEKKKVERAEIQKQIQDLSAKRGQFVREEMAKTGLDDKEAFTTFQVFPVATEQSVATPAGRIALPP